MTSALNGFNRIARYYDPLTRLVFGKAILNSQLEFLSSVPRGSTVLIVGGGTGGMLPSLLRRNPPGSILYIEASSEMLKLAERNVPAEFTTKIEFVHGTHDSLPDGMQFDVIITNFFLDLFPDGEVGTICQQLSSRLRQHGLWLISDFVKGDKWWHGMMLWTMYRFFRFASGISGSRLSSWEEHLRTSGLRATASKLFFRGFIKSGLYTKS
jgi:tRNA (cmo5U34)-methyltransferase